MFIQFTGAQSTGKTTALTVLRKFFDIVGKKVYFIGEISREFKKQGIIDKVDIEADSSSQLLLTNELLLRYLEKYDEVLKDSNEDSIVIAERSSICCLAYSRHLLNQSSLHSAILKQTEKFIEVTQKFKDLYTIYFPTKIAFKQDDIRNENSREIINSEIKKILFDFQIKHLETDSRSVQLNVQEILEYINFTDYTSDQLTRFVLSISDYNFKR